MVNREPGMTSLGALLELLIAGDSGFDGVLLQHADERDELLQRTVDNLPAHQLLTFIEANLSPLSELPAGETRKLAKRLQRLLVQAEKLLAEPGDTYSKEVAEALKGVFWPEPPQFEVTAHGDTAHKDGRRAGRTRAAAAKEASTKKTTTRKSKRGAKDAADAGRKKSGKGGKLEAERDAPGDAGSRLDPPHSPPPSTQPAADAPPTPSPDAGVADLLARFVTYGRNLQAPLQTRAKVVTEADEAGWTQALDEYQALLMPLSVAAEMVGFEALRDIVEHALSHLARLHYHDAEAATRVGEVLKALPEALLDWLHHPEQEAAAQNVGKLLQELGGGGPNIDLLTQATATLANDADALSAVLEAADVAGMIADTLEQIPETLAYSPRPSSLPVTEEEDLKADDGNPASQPETDPSATSAEAQPATEISSELTEVYQRFAQLAETVEPVLLERLLGLLEAIDEAGWKKIGDSCATVLEPFSIAAEMIGFEALSGLLLELSAGVRNQEFPADEVARAEAVQRLADLPGLFVVLFYAAAQAEEPLPVEELLTTVATDRTIIATVEAAMAAAHESFGEFAADAVMVLDTAGIRELLEEALEPRATDTTAPQTVSHAEPPTDDQHQPVVAIETPPEPDEPEVSTFSAAILELLGILAAGVAECRTDMEHIAEGLANANPAGWSAGTSRYADLLDRLVLAAETIEYEALHQGVKSAVERLHQLDFPTEEQERRRWAEQLEGFPALLLGFLAAPHRDERLLALYNFFDENGFLSGRSEKERMDFLEGLSRGPTEEPAADEVPILRAADLALTPDEDADRSVLESVAGEGPRLAAELSTLLGEVIRGEDVAGNLRHAQRAVHTLKGSANICGIKGIANISHHLEDLLEHLADRGEAPDEAIAAILVDAADALESALETVFGGEQHDPQVFAEIVRKVVGWSHGVRRGLGAPIEVEMEIPVADNDPRQSETPAATAATGNAQSGTPQIETVDALQRQMGELAIALTRAESRITVAREALSELVDQQRRNLLNVEVLEELADIRGLGTRFPGRPAQSGDAAPGTDYDPLELEEYNELYITTRRLHEGVADARALTEGLAEALAVLDELSQTQSRLSHEMQGVIAAARRVPVAQYIARLQRVVRQTCRSTGKQAEMEVEGVELEVDNEVMDKLLPALLHILRNAVDHGIEPPEERLAAGKLEIGRLALRFARIGNAIEVRFSDDGRGLDYARVRTKAVANGLLDPDIELEDRELALLTLKPGFSTRDAVSEISGRGVGMNVVDAAIRELKGALSIDSERGKGYTLTLRLPTSTISMYTLLVSVAGESYAVPGSEVKQAVSFADGEVETEGDRRWFRYGEERYILEPMDELLGIQRGRSAAERPIVLIAYSDVDERAVLADSLDDSRTVIAKKLGSRVPPIPGISSATILGDGRIVPIIELRRLLRRDELRFIEGYMGTAELEAPTLPRVLIVDDSLSMRKSLSQLIGDSGWEPLTASDGLDALRVIEEGMPDVVLVDMEMPRMNGLELTAHLRNNPQTRHLPIAMITSRATRGHREKALEAGVNHYLVKPYREDEVVDFIEHSLHSRDSGGEPHENEEH